MDLERVAAVLRPRSAWEAVDLGYGMVRTWWRAVFAPWVAVTLPVWAVVLALTAGRPVWGFFLLWWLKPAFDRIPLYVVSRALFGAVPSFRETLRSAHPLKGFWVAVTALRLDPARSFYLPVRQLEGFRGPALRTRRAVLRGGDQTPAVLLTLVSLALELLLLGAVAALIAWLVPETASPRWSELLEGYLAGSSPLWFHLLAGLGWWLAVTLVEPFYVAGGFALYLNRRTLLEGWDVELAFRRLARRLVEEAEKRVSGRRAGGLAAPPAAMLLAVVLSTAAAPAPAAQGPETAAEAPSVTSTEPQRAIEEILADPEFGRTETVRTWKFRFEPEVEPGRDRRSALPPILAALAEGALWLIAGGLLAAALIYLVRNRGWRVPAARSAASEPAPERPLVSGWLDPAAPLPDDVAGAALGLLDSGRPLEALSLLYRGALAALDRRPGVSVRESWTESECLRHLEARLPTPAGGFFKRLTLAWQGAAYAHREPAADELQALCSEWPQHFEAAR